jgi:hypothetical protein
MQHGAKVKVDIDLDALGNQIAEMSAHIDAAMHRPLTAIREFDIASGWHVQGALSCAHWLAWRVGWDLRTARERVRVARKLAELPLVDEQLRIGAMSYSQARAISRVATAEKAGLWIEYAKRMPASQLDVLCRSYQNVQAYDQAHGSEASAMAGAVAAAHVAAQRTVTRRSLDNGMVKFEIVVASDEAAIVWAALNAATEPTPADSSLAEPSPAETTHADQTRADQTPAEPPSEEPSSGEHSIAAQTTAEYSLATSPIAKTPTSADRGGQRADASIAGSYSVLGRRYSDDGYGALPTTHQSRGHRSDATRQGLCRAIFKTVEATASYDVEYCLNFESGSMCDVEEATTGR